MFLCNVFYHWHESPQWRASQHSWAEQKHLNINDDVNLWRIFAVMTCVCSCSMHLHSHTSGLRALNTQAVFSFSSAVSYGSCAAAAAGACWTGLSEGIAEDKAGAGFNNACVLEATSGQRPFFKRRFKLLDRLMYRNLLKIEKVVGQNSLLQLRASRVLDQLLTSI